MYDSVILVDLQDVPLGAAEKLKAHQEGWCHRAFSVFIYRRGDGQSIEFLLHQRAAGKYHTPNLWTNTCCSHPRPEEETSAAAHRRLREEMGIVSRLHWVGQFHYIAKLEMGLVENEVDHVFVGTLNEWIEKPDLHEVQAYRWVGLQEIQKELSTSPAQFTPWFQQALSIAIKGIQP